jgi:predicted RNase H-like HicB family nuclease
MATQPMEYTVMVYPAEEGGFFTRVPLLPGCGSQGETIEEALDNTREAIECHLCALRDDGQEVPCEGNCFQGRVTVSL